MSRNVDFLAVAIRRLLYPPPCIVGGCDQRARGRLGKGIVPEPYHVCAKHREPVARILNDAQRRYHQKVTRAAHARAGQILHRLVLLGDLSHELSLASASLTRDGLKFKEDA